MKMIRNLLITLGLIVALNVRAGGDKNKTVTSKIIVKDAVTQELLPGVAIKIDNSNKTLYTDLNGELTITAIKGFKYDLEINYIGYQSENIRFEGGTEKITINLKP
jgi:hypothetical protein